VGGWEGEPERERARARARDCSASAEAQARNAPSARNDMNKCAAGRQRTRRHGACRSWMIQSWRTFTAHPCRRPALSAHLRSPASKSGRTTRAGRGGAGYLRLVAVHLDGHAPSRGGGAAAGGGDHRPRNRQPLHHRALLVNRWDACLGVGLSSQ
jgi:hypothetical protein